MSNHQPAQSFATAETRLVAEDPAQRSRRFEAEYELESPARCVSCESILLQVGVVRLMRTSVNFTSSLPHRGFVIVCPQCHAILPAALHELPV